ncbi:MAG TPA: cation:proton antiporter [Egibacteraceae bacterium]|nr:cation:proton antiporter [Egibacteraceae bacterium]
MTVTVVWLVVNLGIEAEIARPTALALGFALIAAALAGTLLERVGLPRVTGYLLFGMICGPYVMNVITRPMARELQIINGLAVVLIAFIAGLEMNFERMRPRLRAILRLCGVSMAVLYAGLFAALWLIWPWLGMADMGGLQKVAVLGLLTTILASFSPTVTIALIAESRASGPLSEMTLAIVILADLVLILLFTLMMQFVRYAFGSSGEVGLLVSLSWEIFGSFAFGAAVGALFAFYLRHVGRELPLALLAMCALIAGLKMPLHIEPLLAALAAGLVVENIAPPRGDMLREAAERGALPVLVLFFAAAGASLQLDALAVMGWVAAGISATRMGLIWVSTRTGAAYAGIGPPVGNHVWMGLVSQAGVTLGLTLLVAGEYPTWGTTIQTLVVALIALHQLIGPVLFRAALARAGEIGRMDLGQEEDPLSEPLPAPNG